jgi:hypothetical protein
LTKINGIPVAIQEKQHAESFPSECTNLVRAGWTGAPLPPSESDLPLIRRQLTECLSPVRKGTIKPIAIRYDEECDRRDSVFLRTHTAPLSPRAAIEQSFVSLDPGSPKGG